MPFPFPRKISWLIPFLILLLTGCGADNEVKGLRVRAMHQAPLNVRGGTVYSAVHAGRSWYLGGVFTGVNAYTAPNFSSLTLSGQINEECELSGGAFNAPVNSLVLAGNSIYVGGEFTTYHGQPAFFIAKIDATTCALDTNFSPPANNGFNNFVLALAVSGNSLYAGGFFTNYLGVVNAANRLAKLDLATGALDTSFSPPGAVANGFNDAVNALTVAGNSLFIGGNFTDYRGVPNSANRLAKINLSSGLPDTTFSPVGVNNNGFDKSVHALAVAGSSLYVGGAFNTYLGVANSASNLAKLDLTTGVIDNTFSPPGANGFDLPVLALTATENFLYAGGPFTAYRGVAASANALAKLDLRSGAIDTTFSPIGGNGFGRAGKAGPHVLALTPIAGSLYVGGAFTQYRGGSANNVAKLDLTTGVQDTTFIPTGQTINGFDGGFLRALISDGTRLFAGGSMTVYGGMIANHVAKLDDSTFALDTTFNPQTGENGFNAGVYHLATAGNALYATGLFKNYRGVANSANYLAKLDLATGAIDTIFSPPDSGLNGFDNSPITMLVVGTSLYVGGNFDSYRGVAQSACHLAKLDLNTGAIDTNFSPPGSGKNGFNGSVMGLATSGRSLYLAGSFTSYRGVADSTFRLAKLSLSTGALDTTFSPPGIGLNGFDDFSTSILTAGNSVYVGGNFTAYKGITNSAFKLAKLDQTTGAIDTTFSPTGIGQNGFDSPVNTLTTDGTSLFAGGNFTAYRGAPNSANFIAKLNLASGIIDSSFSPVGVMSNGFNGNVQSLAISGGHLYVGGGFSRYRGGISNRFAVLDKATGNKLY